MKKQNPRHSSDFFVYPKTKSLGVETKFAYSKGCVWVGVGIETFIFLGGEK